MTLELAEDGLSKQAHKFYNKYPTRSRSYTRVRGYARNPNYVPDYYRRKPGHVGFVNPGHKFSLNDSSLFAFHLTEMGGGGIINANVNTQKIVNASIYLVIPDPDNRKAPRRVRLDMMDGLPDSEFMKVLAYAEPFNPPAIIEDAIQTRMSLGDPAAENMEYAGEFVNSVFETAPNGTTIQDTSFWDQTLIPGIKNKYTAAGLLIYKFLF